MIKLFLVLSVVATSLLGFGRAPAPSAAAPSTYAVDPNHSVVLFRTRHLGVSYFHGRFNMVEGTIVYDPDRPGESSILVTIPAASVDTNSDGRDRHLKSPDFFSAEEFPEITFESSTVVAKGDTLKVTGDLTLHGVTKEITVDAMLVGQAETQRGVKIGFESVFEIDARDFGIAYMQDSDQLGPGVRITVAVECIRQD